MNKNLKLTSSVSLRTKKAYKNMRRSLALLKNAHPAHRVLKIEDKSIEKFVKVLGKRHTVRHQTYMEMTREIKDFNITTPFAEFKTAMTRLPIIEKEIERGFVDTIKEKLTEPEKEELEMSYQERRLKVDGYTYISNLNARRTVVPEEPLAPELPDYKIPDPVNPKEEDIGKFFDIPAEVAKTLFMNGYFGDYMRDHCLRCDTFDIMLREETLKIINMIKMTQNLNKHETYAIKDLSPLNGLEPLQTFGYLITNHPETYVAVFTRIAWLMNDYIYKSKNLGLLRMMKNSSDLFNSFAAILVQELGKSQLFKAIGANYDFQNPENAVKQMLAGEEIQELVKNVLDFSISKVTAEEDLLKSIHFGPFVEHLSSVLKFNLGEHEIEIDLTQYVKLENRFNGPKELVESIGKLGGLGTGYILTGTRGTGKSQVLSGLAAWANNEGNWIILKAPRGSDFTRNASVYLWEPGAFYLHPEVGFDILKEISELNKGKLQNIKVDSELYGKYSISGFHSEYDKGYEPLPSQHVFLRDEQVWTDVWKDYYPVEILEEMFKGVRELTVEERHSRFDYELNSFTPDKIPKVFLKVLEGESILRDITFDQLFDTHLTKRKSKKRMLPNDSADVLSFTHKPKRIEGQDLFVDSQVKSFQGNIMKPLKEVLPNPNTLQDLVDFAMKNHGYIVNVLFEIFEQLYRTDDANVMVLVDEYNEFFKPSEYPSAKYSNYRQLGECIPPYDISLSRLFMRFDGHMIKNGVKVVAVSEKLTRFTKNLWVNDPANIGDQFNFEVGNMTLDDLRNLIKYYTYFEWAQGKLFESDIAAIYMQSQGNFALTLENITYSPEKTY